MKLAIVTVDKIIFHLQINWFYQYYRSYVCEYSYIQEFDCLDHSYLE
jgi:hypothetical protein